MSNPTLDGLKYTHGATRTWLKDGKKIEIVKNEKDILGKRYARFEDGKVLPFEGNEVIEEVLLDTHNYVFDSEVRPGGRCRIVFNLYVVYSFQFANLQMGLRKAQYYLDRLRHFPVPLIGRSAIENNIVGRKVWFWTDEAVVEQFMGELGMVQLRADNPKKRFTQLPWSPMGEGEHKIREDLLSNSIHWFREDGE